MDDEPEVIRQQMAVTRSSLTEKIEALENQVVGTVHNATAAVSDTVDSVKSAVRDTVDSVKGLGRDAAETVRETFDLRHHVAAHPWASFGLSVAAGYLGGALLGPRSASARIGHLHSNGEAYYEPRYQTFAASHNGGPRPETSRAEPEEPHGFLHDVGEKFAPEIDKLKGMALGALFGLVRDVVVRAAPEQLGGQLSTLVDDMTRKFGGQPVRGSLLSDSGQVEGKSRERATAGLG